MGDICEVVWFDAWQDDDADIDQATWKDTYEVRTVGVLRRKDPVVSLTGDSLEPSDGFRNVYHIPLPYISRIVSYGRPLET